SGAVFGAIIAAAAVAHLAFKVNPILAFWTAYIFTRPLGANIGDYLGGDATETGGLGLGAELVSGVFLSAIVAGIVYLTMTKKDTIVDPHFVVETEAEHAGHQKGK